MVIFEEQARENLVKKNWYDVQLMNFNTGFFFFNPIMAQAMRLKIEVLTRLTRLSLVLALLSYMYM